MIKKERLVCSVNVYDYIYDLYMIYDDEMELQVKGVEVIKKIDEEMISNHNFEKFRDIVFEAKTFGVGLEWVEED